MAAVSMASTLEDLPGRRPVARHKRGRIGAWLAPLAAIALVSACSSPAATPGLSPSAAATPVASPVASPSPTASPTAPGLTPSPIPSTAQRVQAYAAAPAPWQASATMTGTIGGTLGKLSGTFAALNDDATGSVTSTVGTKTMTIEQILVGDASYLRSPGEAWRRDLPAEGTSRAISLRSALLIADYTDDGMDTVTASGRDAAKIGESLGLIDPGVVPPNTTAKLTLDASGKLATLQLGFDNSGQHWDVTYQFAANPSVAAITAPEDAVIVDLHQKQLLLFYPDGWTLKSVGEDGDVFDLFVSPSAAEVVIVYCIATKASLKTWTAEGRTYYSKLLKAKVSATGAQTVNGVPWNITQWAKATSNVMDVPAHVVNAAAVHGGLGCDVQWHGPTNADEASAALTQFVGTLQFLN